MILAVAGGLLWIAYGPLELLEPFGADTRYDEAKGYDVVTDRAAWTLTSATGAVALLLTALAARRLLASRLAVAAAVLGGVALLATAVGFDPLFTGPRILGTALLAFTLLRAPQGRIAGLGALGLLLLPLWPLVFAVEVVPPALGAALFAAWGAGWVLVGRR